MRPYVAACGGEDMDSKRPKSEGPGFDSYEAWLKSAAFNGMLTAELTLRSATARDEPVRLFRTRQSTAVTDPAVPELTLQLLKAGVFDYRADFGFGRFSGRKLPGQFDVTAPNLECRIDGAGPRATPQELLILAMPTTRLEALLGLQSGLYADGGLGRLHAQMTTCPAIASLMELLWAQGGEPGATANGLFVDGVLMAIGALLARHAGAPVKPGKSAGGLAPWQIRRVTDYLDMHFARSVSLTELAAIAHLSPFHFARAFKQSLGAPPHAYLTGLRVTRAKAMLTETTQPITEIAAAVGYESPQTLARVFQRQVGISPREYRRRTAL